MTLIHERVDTARRGEKPCVICGMQSGWLVLGDIQNQAGYCVLLSDPVVGSINELTEAGRISFSNDMWAVGDALLHVTDSFRINYSVLGNKDAALHAHINPRYTDEPEETRGKMLRPYFENPILFDIGRDLGIMDAIREHLQSQGLTREGPGT